MKVLGLKNNELHLDEDGQIAILTEKKAYAQILENVMRTILGEVQSNTSLGIPYFENAFSSPTDLQNWRNAVQERIMSFDFVDSIQSFTTKLDYQNRTLSYELRVTTDEGTVIISD